MKTKGFVLMETIVVISVLCVVLVVLYGSYSKVLITVKKKSLYNNTEYVYKTAVLRRYLEENAIIPESDYSSAKLYVYCSNTLSSSRDCYDEDTENDYENDLFEFIGVSALYITMWDTTKIDASKTTKVEATTQNFIRNLDPTDDDGYRIIVMFESENNDTNIPVFEYGTLRFGERR